MLSTSALRLPTQHINKTEWYKKKYQSNTLSLLDLCFFVCFYDLTWFSRSGKFQKSSSKQITSPAQKLSTSIGVTCFGDAKHQAQSINKSLTALGDVIEVGLDRGFLSDWLRLDRCVWCWFLASLKRKKQVCPWKHVFSPQKSFVSWSFFWRKMCVAPFPKRTSHQNGPPWSILLVDLVGKIIVTKPPVGHPKMVV